MLLDPRLKVKVQIVHGGGFAMGPGKAGLLAAIRDTGSISAAARAMGMSYRRAWMLVDAMNHAWRAPLVETAHGGARGGGAVLSAFGVDVLARYQAIERAAAEAAWAAAGALLADLAAEQPSATTTLPGQ